jgi:hypothetical protein
MSSDMATPHWLNSNGIFSMSEKTIYNRTLCLMYEILINFNQIFKKSILKLKTRKSILFSDYEGFDPEQKAREFGYDTLKELFSGDAMRPYVFIEQKQQLPNMVCELLANLINFEPSKNCNFVIN